MGLFSIVSDAWNGATHVASDAWNGATHLASDAWNGATDFAGDVAHDAWSGLNTLGGGIWSGLCDVGHFLAHRWKTIAAVAIGTLVFVAVATLAPELLPGLLALAPEAAPWLVLGAAGAASGASSKLFDDLVNGRPPGWDILQSAAITGVLTVATAGVLSWAAPRVAEALPILKPFAEKWVVAGSDAGDGAGGAPISIPDGPSGVPDPSVPAPASDATASGDATVAEAAPPPTPRTYDPMSATQAALRAPKSSGIIGLIAGDEGNSTNKRLNHDAREDGSAPSR